MNAFLRTGLWLGGAALAAGAAGAAALWSGAYDVGADAPHTRPVYALLEFARERSVTVRASALTVPSDLDDAERVRRGAGNYAAMCAGCHLSPQAGPSELSRGLYPAPPNLSQRDVDAASAFWTIKHGIKASGMPAWGGSMDDAHVWDLVAFLGRLPSLDARGYGELVARSDGHSHGGGEDMSGHGHGGSDGHGSSGHGTGGHGTAGHDDSGGHADAGGDDAHGHAHADGQAHEHAPANDDRASEPRASPPASAQKPAPSPPEKPPHRHADGQPHQH